MDDPERTQPPAAAGAAVVILLPVFNDWAALGLLLRRLDTVLADAGLVADILVADDGSTEDCRVDRFAGPWVALGRLEVLHLRRNLGHQRAIAIGLAFLEAERPGRDVVVVMDSDGEDDPADVPRLLARCEQAGRRPMVFAERAKRSESPFFRVCYHAYRIVHRVLTGRSVRVGNFSVVPRRRLESLVVTSELWNHYAAAALASRQPFCTVSTARARRLDGRSKMNFVGLVIHGLSAVSVYGDAIGVRLMIATGAMIALTLLALVATVLIRLTTDLAIPGWATTVFGVLLIVLLQAILFLVVSSFMVLAGRTAPGFLPKRDYGHYVGSVVEVFRR